MLSDVGEAFVGLLTGLYLITEFVLRLFCLAPQLVKAFFVVYAGIWRDLFVLVAESMPRCIVIVIVVLNK
jgi:hypothetical protein